MTGKRERHVDVDGPLEVTSAQFKETRLERRSGITEAVRQRATANLQLDQMGDEVPGIEAGVSASVEIEVQQVHATAGAHKYLVWVEIAMYAGPAGLRQ